MLFRSFRLVLVFVASLVALGSMLTVSFSAKASAPVVDPEPHGQVIGFYNKGKLIDATALPPSGAGFVHLFDKRGRHWGSQGLVDLLVAASAEIARIYPRGERLQIGDLSRRKGGKISRHASHQNGLDADIVYYRTDLREQGSDDGDEGFVESFVRDGKVTPNFDVERNWELIKLFEASGRLARIFVHPAIKNRFCEYARSRGEYKKHSDALRRLALLDNHDDHLHLRLSCPANSPECIKQPDPAPGTGCPPAAKKTARKKSRRTG